MRVLIVAISVSRRCESFCKSSLQLCAKAGAAQAAPASASANDAIAVERIVIEL
jgi:hypothetical protein